MDAVDDVSDDIARREVQGRVIARWESERALLELEDGFVIWAFVPAQIRDAFDVGIRVWLALDGFGSPVVVRLDDPGTATTAPAPRRSRFRPGQPGEVSTGLGGRT